MKDKEAEFDNQLLTYNASLDVRFDLDEQMKQDQLIAEVELDEDAMDTIKENMDFYRGKEGGEEELEQLMQTKYTNVLDLEKKAKKNKEDVDIARDLALAREEYDAYKVLEKDTKEDQVGYDPEEAEQPTEKLQIVAYVRTQLDLLPKEITAIKAELDTLRAGDKKFLDAHLKEAYRYYTEYNIELKKNIEDLDMQYKTNYLWTRYKIMKAYVEKKDKEDMEANPELALQKRTAELEAEKKKKKKEALNDDDQVKLLEEFTKASEAKDADLAVKKLLES